MENLVLTLIGPDRPGLVESVADAIATAGGNWLESRMAHLGGQFAGLLRIEVAADQAAGLRTALAKLERAGLKLVIERAGATSAAEQPRAVRVDLVGQDRPGIVREISQFLASLRINVEELATDRESAAMSGEPLFRATARLAVPAGVELGTVRDGLERIASDLMVEIKLAPAEPAPR